MGSSSQLVLYTLLLASTVFFFVVFFINRRAKKSSPEQPNNIKSRLPPGPPMLPVIGNLHQLGHPLHRKLHRLSQEHGDLMLLKLGSVPAVVISSADLTREVIKTHDVTFGARAVGRVARRITYDVTDITFAPYGEYWRELRKVAVLELLSPKRVQSFQPVRVDEVNILLRSIAETNSAPFDLTELLHSLSNNVLCRVAFGRKFAAAGGDDDGTARRKSPQELLRETQALVGTLVLSDFFPWLGWINKVNGFDARVDRNFRELDEVYDTVIKEHLDPDRTKPEEEDLVDVLLRIRQDPSRLVSKVDSFVKAMIGDMFIAGTETTAATLVWAMTELMRNPSSLKRAQDEVRETVKGRNRVDEADLSRLPYLKAVIKETLRLHAPTPLLIPRETVEECQVRGYTIPARSTVFINGFSMAMDPKSWEDPLEFRPERFLLDSSVVDFGGKHYELIPFGVGRRSCPGVNFSAVVMENAIANLLYCFDWELPEGVRREDVDMEEGVGIVVQKKSPLNVVARPVIDVSM